MFMLSTSGTPNVLGFVISFYDQLLCCDFEVLG